MTENSSEDFVIKANSEWMCFMKDCKNNAEAHFYCPSCRTFAYCSNECRVKDWDKKHWKKCKSVLEPVQEFFAMLAAQDKKKIFKFFKVKNEHEGSIKNLPKEFSIECRNEQNNTPLVIAVEQGDFALIELFLRLGAGINRKGSGGNTPLHIACGKGTNSLVKLLLKNGADINIANSKGETPAFAACDKGHQFALLPLIAAGADCKRANNEGKTPLDIAAMRRHFHLVAFILDHEKSFRESKTLLFDVIRSGDADFAQVLIENGMSIEIKSDKDLTPLEEAKAANLPKLVRFFDDKKNREVLSHEIKEKNEAEKIAEEKRKEEERLALEEKKKQEEALQQEQIRLQKEYQEKLEIERKEMAKREAEELEALTSDLTRASVSESAPRVVKEEPKAAIELTPLQVELNKLLDFSTVHRMLAFLKPAHESMKAANPGNSSAAVQAVKDTASQASQAMAALKNAIDSTFDEDIMAHCRGIIASLTTSSTNLKESMKTFMASSNDAVREDELKKSADCIESIMNAISGIPSIQKAD